MFVQDSAPLPIPVTLARDRLLAYLHDDARLQPDTWHAAEQGASLLRCPGVQDVATRVTAHTGPARRRGVSTVIPIWWTPADSTGAPVPALDATLELDPRPDGTSQLTLCGRYLPPLTRNSVPAEHLVIGPAARAAAHSYLAAFTRAIAAPTAPTAPTAPSCRAVNTGRPSLTNRVTVSGTSPHSRIAARHLLLAAGTNTPGG
jgi:hypothetical protein